MIAGNQDYDGDYGTWDIDGQSVPVASTYRIAWRLMAATTGYRTLYPALIPPGTKHVNGVHSAGPIVRAQEVLVGATASSILSDFFIRAAGIANLYGPVFEGLPLPLQRYEQSNIVRLFLRLNCLTAAYSDLWESITGETWTERTPLRKPLERLLAQIQIDVEVAISLGVTIDELCMIYRTQFPVMRSYDQKKYFDVEGKLVPSALTNTPEYLGKTVGSVQWHDPSSSGTYEYRLPFLPLDREQEMRKAYAQSSPSVQIDQ